MSSIDRLREYHAAHRPGWQVLEIAARLRNSWVRARNADQARQRDAVAQATKSALHCSLDFEGGADPAISVIVFVNGDPTLTPRCLGSVGLQESAHLEVIVVRTQSNDGQAPDLTSIPGVRVMTFGEGVGPTAALSNAARVARGELTLFVDSQDVLLPGCIAALAGAMRDDSTVGVIGSKLVAPTGRLRQAGCIVWKDGTRSAIGHFGNPFAAPYLSRREVDCCALGGLMIRSDLLRRIGYFDEAFTPNCYSDADLCFAVRATGTRVIYEPFAVVMSGGARTPRHQRTDLSTGSDRSTHGRIKRQFVSKWTEDLATRIPVPARHRGPTELLGSHPDERPSVLVCDWSIPTPDRDSGSVRMDAILRLLASLTSWVTFIPSSPYGFMEYAAPLREAGIEVFTGRHEPIKQLMRSRRDFYNLAILSRSQVGEQRLAVVKRYQRKATVVFDTVDLKSLRIEREIQVTGSSGDGSSERERRLEGRLIRGSDITAVVSEEEGVEVERLWPGARTVLLPNVHVPVEVQVPDRVGRRGILFVGSFHHPPNGDAVRWFSAKILPLVRRDLDIDFLVAGADATASDVASWGPNVRYLGWVPDIAGVLNEVVLSVAPLRYGAGMKGKVGQAMSVGLPVVTTSIGAEGMGITDGIDALIRDDPAGFAEAVVRLHQDGRLWGSISLNARRLVRRRWTSDAMRVRLEHLLRGDYADAAR